MRQTRLKSASIGYRFCYGKSNFASCFGSHFHGRYTIGHSLSFASRTYNLHYSESHLFCQCLKNQSYNVSSFVYNASFLINNENGNIVSEVLYFFCSLTNRQDLFYEIDDFCSFKKEIMIIVLYQ